MCLFGNLRYITGDDRLCAQSLFIFFTLMADLRPIEYPEHLNHHNLTQQELSVLTDAQQALAKDWNIINRKVDWTVKEMVDQHNILVEHDKLLETWKKVLWMVGVLAGSGGVVALIKFLNP